MNLSFFRRRLFWKIFLSYLAVIIISLLVVGLANRMMLPNAFDRYAGEMQSMMAGQGQGMMGGQGMLGARLGPRFFDPFRSAATEAMLVAAPIALVSAMLASLYLSRRVVSPVRRMTTAARRISEGHYSERVPQSKNTPHNQLDELGQLALDFNQMAASLEQTEAMRRQLIGDVSHELRTPLATIQGSMEGLMDGVLPATPETYQQIYQEAARLQRLVADLQELSRVEAGAFALDLQPVSLAAVVEHLSARLGRQFEEKGVQLKVDLPADLPRVLADEDRLHQVMLNLAGNALQYTPPGGQVQISARPSGREVRVAVQDSGIGIAAEHLPHLFTRFYRVDKSRSRAGGGSGIGLTIARHLVEAQGGSLWAESPGEGQGSTFTFTLPAV